MESFKEETITEEPELKELPSDVLDDKVQAGLLFLAYCFENGTEPTRGSIYGAADLKTKGEKDALETILRNHGIELSSEGKNLKLYRLELREGGRAFGLQKTTISSRI